MLGNTYPATVYAQSSIVTAPGGATVFVRSTSAATELANDLVWLQNN